MNQPLANSGAGVPVIGVGASAGGLEALAQFFGGVAGGSGLAFVVVQHMDPQRQAMLPELLQRVTPMLVRQAEHRMTVQPDCVYVIPPDKDLSIQQDTLYLQKPSQAHGLRLPIDFFFCSLAQDRQGRGIAVVLSGMGADGTEGLRAIRQQGGFALVQDPATARFDAMPCSAIEARLAQVVAAPDALGAHITECVQRWHAAEAARPASTADPAADDRAFDTICRLLHTRTSHDFSQYKPSTIHRRVERRMAIHRLLTVSDYAAFLQANPQEVDLLFRELLIGVTRFFREPAVWESLRDKALPALIDAHTHGEPLRAWVAGCSSGEEAYTLAMIFLEAAALHRPGMPVALQIFATDLDPDAIARARLGLYAPGIEDEVGPERLNRFFTKVNGRFRIGQDIRRMVVFAPHNLIMDPPFTRLDILTCRNVLIYLGADLQKRLLPLFHYSLKPGGALVLGPAESIGGFSERFMPLDAKARIYRRKESPLPLADLAFPTRTMDPPDSLMPKSSSLMPPPSLQAHADQLLLQKFAPPAVFINADGDVLFISGRTGRYLEPAAGKANWNIYAMAREGLRTALTVAVPQALHSGEAVVTHNLSIEDDGETHCLDLTVFPVTEPPDLQGTVMVVFNARPAMLRLPGEPPVGPAAQGRVAELEQALLRAREEIRTIREQMQVSHEELRSANEELKFTNEELQSTNEELTTSREEMQSLNEELQTVNAELQSKVDEWSATSNDMKNLLDSTDIATVFLDNALHVRRFTSQATRIFSFIPVDVGRPLADIVHQLAYPGLLDDVRAVLQTLVFSEKQIPGQDGAWYLVRIMPYCTVENQIDGVVMTFIDISEAKRLEAELRAARNPSPGVA